MRLLDFLTGAGFAQKGTHIILLFLERMKSVKFRRVWHDLINRYENSN